MRGQRQLGRCGAVVILALGASTAGCGETTAAVRAPPAWSNASAGDAAARSGLPVETWFPLVDGHLFQYRTRADEGGDGLLVARVFRASARVGELRTPSGTRRFEYREEGLATLDKNGHWALVFKLPIAAGTTWRGEHGGQSRWDETDLTVEVAAGRFEGCARVVEERGGDRPARFVTTFCPQTGVVLLEAMSGAALERAELAYVGPPLDLGPDGTSRVP